MHPQVPDTIPTGLDLTAPLAVPTGTGQAVWWTTWVACWALTLAGGWCVAWAVWHGWWGPLMPVMFGLTAWGGRTRWGLELDVLVLATMAGLAVFWPITLVGFAIFFLLRSADAALATG